MKQPMYGIFNKSNYRKSIKNDLLVDAIQPELLTASLIPRINELINTTSCCRLRNVCNNGLVLPNVEE
jgi:hypothetical protein